MYFKCLRVLLNMHQLTLNWGDTEEFIGSHRLVVLVNIRDENMRLKKWFGLSEMVLLHIILKMGYIAK